MAVPWSAWVRKGNELRPVPSEGGELRPIMALGLGPLGEAAGAQPGRPNVLGNG